MVRVKGGTTANGSGYKANVKDNKRKNPQNTPKTSTVTPRGNTTKKPQTNPYNVVQVVHALFRKQSHTT